MLELPTIRPAINAPYAAESPAAPDSVAQLKQNAMAASGTISWREIIHFDPGSSICSRLDKNHITISNRPTAMASLMAIARPAVSASPPVANAPMISIMGITARSCAISTDTVVRPTGVFKSSVSSRILMDTAVDDRAGGKEKKKKILIQHAP